MINLKDLKISSKFSTDFRLAGGDEDNSDLTILSNKIQRMDGRKGDEDNSDLTILSN